MILHQFEGKSTYNGQRVYIDKAILTKAGFVPGARFRTATKPEEHTIELCLDGNGSNMVSKKVKNQSQIPVIDKSGSEIRNALDGCAHIIVTLFQDRVMIKGIRKSADLIKEKEISDTLTSISFCAGAGISSQCIVEAGFKEVAAVEWNPKSGKEDKLSDIYMVNHPDAVMFNLPMQKLSGMDLPYADVWNATLDCSDFSKAANGTGKERFSMHLFMHLMRLFWERDQAERPRAILLENVPEFEKVAGVSLELCLQEEGFFVSKAKLNSLEYGSRTKRERFFLVASIYEGFTFPEPSGRKSNSIADAGILNVSDLEWVTPQECKTLNYFLQRQKNGMSHNHRLTAYDITRDSYIGTITKSHHKIQPENWLVHPELKGKYAYLRAEQVRDIHNISKNYYLGNSNKQIVECIGQSVCINTFKAITNKLFAFLKEKMHLIKNIEVLEDTKKCTTSNVEYEQLYLF